MIWKADLAKKVSKFYKKKNEKRRKKQIIKDLKEAAMEGKNCLICSSSWMTGEDADFIKKLGFDVEYINGYFKIDW